MDTFLSILGILIVGLALFLIWQQSKKVQPNSTLDKQLDTLSKQVTDNMALMFRQLTDTTKHVNERLKENTEQLNMRLKENVEVIQRQHRQVGERLDNAAKVVNTVNTQLSKLQESNQRIYEIGKDIASLQDILRAPKLRGGLGELFLENLLAQIFPHKDMYALQYAFKSGEKVDAALFLRDSMMVSVDAKFPLENFKKFIESQAENDERKTSLFRREFVKDVKKHVDDIARKYILPDEGTLDFALMYIPAENVYYETITKNLQGEVEVALSEYALSKKVVPVSPNTFYIYLQTLLMGLKGLQIEEGTKQILRTLSQLKGDFGKFADDYDLVGTHLGRAQNSFDKSEKRLEKLKNRLDHADGIPLIDQEEVALVEGSV